MLEALGVSHLAEGVYLRLLQHPGRTTGELCDELAKDRATVTRALAELADRGLAEQTTAELSGRWTAVAPDIGVEPLLQRREEELRRTRLRITELMRSYHRGQEGAGSSELVEVVMGRDAIAGAWSQMRAGAKDQVLVFDRSPHVQSSRADDEFEFDLIARGVVWRVIYECAQFRDAEALSRISALMEAGERSAMLPQLPFKLAVVDSRWALVPMYSGAELESALIVRPSLLLDALVATFELHWSRAMPIPDPQHALPGDVLPQHLDRDLLVLLAAGLTDESMARQLGVSIRTVQRRVRMLMDLLEARTRFQAGIQAARSGWL
ncbi:MarR family transcriptional regulator [Solihabitans fulvus]|uniref:MarR family transcriptional regulator n=1 Tax=Solihabitans fulvus TaxID=1892852 RepID=A0A5B2X6I7_9PSEU|nr:MarR family transcriptional regulator [Solihabitans fulvus]KAA2258826.1 MarR family transcriptional regulator [Solihabitans fulvus]